MLIKSEAVDRQFQVNKHLMIRSASDNLIIKKKQSNSQNFVPSIAVTNLNVIEHILF